MEGFSLRRRRKEKHVRIIGAICWGKKLMPQASTNNQELFINEFHGLHEGFPPAENK